jgi:hypothetical protein
MEAYSNSILVIILVNGEPNFLLGDQIMLVLFFQELMMGIHCLNHNPSTDQNRSNNFFIFF